MPKHGEIFVLNLLAWMLCSRALQFPNFWRSELHHGVVFLIDSAQLSLVCSTVGKTFKKIKLMHEFTHCTQYVNILAFSLFLKNRLPTLCFCEWTDIEWEIENKSFCDTCIENKNIDSYIHTHKGWYVIQLRN